MKGVRSLTIPQMNLTAKKRGEEIRVEIGPTLMIGIKNDDEAGTKTVGRTMIIRSLKKSRMIIRSLARGMGRIRSLKKSLECSRGHLMIRN